MAEWLLPASTLALCFGGMAMLDGLKRMKSGSVRVGWFFMSLAYALLTGAWACLILFILTYHVFNL